MRPGTFLALLENAANIKKKQKIVDKHLAFA
jgi:hypothetical protein